MQSQLARNPTYSPIATGHSLGGAIASLASASLVHFFPSLTTYTLGQFRTGNPAYAAYIDRILPYPRMYRITHSYDGIPQTIHQSSGYLHHSREHWELEPFGPKNTYRCGAGDDQVGLTRGRKMSQSLIEIRSAISLRSDLEWGVLVRCRALMLRICESQPRGWPLSY